MTVAEIVEKWWKEEVGCDTSPFAIESLTKALNEFTKTEMKELSGAEKSYPWHIRTSKLESRLIGTKGVNGK